MKKYIIGAGAVLLSIISPGKEISLETALSKAAKGNPDIRIKELEVKRKELEIVKSKKDFLPKLTVTTDYDFREDADDDKGFGPQRIDAVLPLYTGGKLSNRLSLSKLNRLVEESENHLLKLTIRERVIFKYFEILNLNKQVEIADGVLVSLRKQKERLASLFNGNKLIPKSEMLKVEADILSMETSKKRAENEAMIGKYELSILLGMGIDEKISLAEYEYRGADLESYRLEDGIKYALEDGNRVEIEELKLEEAQYERELAVAEFKPDIGLNWEYNIDKEDEDAPDWQFTLRAKWELFSWGSSLDNLKQSDYRVEQAKIDHGRNIDEIKLKIRQAYTEMMTLYMEVESQKKNLEIAKENLKIDTMRYDAAIISSLDYLDSVNRLKSSEERFYLLQRNLMLAIDQYENSLK